MTDAGYGTNGNSDHPSRIDTIHKWLGYDAGCFQSICVFFLNSFKRRPNNGNLYSLCQKKCTFNSDFVCAPPGVEGLKFTWLIM